MNLVVASFVRAVRHCFMHSASERTMLNRNDCHQLPSLSLFSFASHVFIFARIRDRQLIDVPDAVQIHFAAEIYECVKVPYTHRIQNISERIYSRCCSAGHCPMSSSNRIRMPLWLRYACYPCVYRVCRGCNMSDDDDVDWLCYVMVVWRTNYCNFVHTLKVHSVYTACRSWYLIFEIDWNKENTQRPQPATTQWTIEQ